MRRTVRPCRFTSAEPASQILNPWSSTTSEGPGHGHACHVLKSSCGTEPYKFIGFGAMEVTKPYKFIGFGAMEVTKPYKKLDRLG